MYTNHVINLKHVSRIKLNMRKRTHFSISLFSCLIIESFISGKDLGAGKTATLYCPNHFYFQCEIISYSERTEK